MLRPDSYWRRAGLGVSRSAGSVRVCREQWRRNRIGLSDRRRRGAVRAERWNGLFHGLHRGRPARKPGNRSLRPVPLCGRYSNNKVVGFTIAASGSPGALTAFSTGSPFAVGLAPVPVTLDPSGHFLYVGNTFDHYDFDVQRRCVRSADADHRFALEHRACSRGERHRDRIALLGAHRTAAGVARGQAISWSRRLLWLSSLSPCTDAEHRAATFNFNDIGAARTAITSTSPVHSSRAPRRRLAASARHARDRVTVDAPRACAADKRPGAGAGHGAYRASGGP